MGNPRTNLSVTCYSGHKGDERPVRFRLGDVDHMVEEVVDQWFGPADAYFMVRADDGGTYVLRQHRGVGDSEWSLEGHRKGVE